MRIRRNSYLYKHFGKHWTELTNKEKKRATRHYELMRVRRRMDISMVGEKKPIPVEIKSGGDRIMLLGKLYESGKISADEFRMLL